MTRLRILIAEDEAIIAMLLGEVLQALGHDICASVATEEDAVATAATEQPDLIIIDAGLGAGSGMAAIAQINAVRPTPHIFITGNTASVRAAQPNAIILEKPFYEACLVNAIEQAMRLEP